MTKAIRFYRK